MGKQLEQITRIPSQRHLHRSRLLPIDELLEAQVTLKVSAVNGLKQQGDVLASPSWELGNLQVIPLPVVSPGQRGREGLLSQNGDASLDRNGDEQEEFEKLATIPVMVLKGISSSQGRSAPVMKSEISTAASNAGVVGLGNIAGYGFKYGTNLLIQRSLGAAQFGLFSVSLSLVTLLASILDLGLDSAMIRYIAIYMGKQKTHLLRSLTLFCTALVGVTGMLGALLLLFFSSPLATLVHKPQTSSTLLILAPLIPLLCLQTVWIGGLQGLKEFKTRVFVQRFLVPLIVFLLMIVVVLFLPNIIWVAVVTYVSALLSAIINMYFLLRAISRRGGLRVEGYEVRSWLGFAIPNFLTNIVNIVLDSIDTVLLALFVPAVAIGQYSAAIKISGFILLPMFSLNVMFTPTIAELHAKGEKQKLEAMFKVVTQWTITLSLAIFCIAALFAVPLLQISGNSFVAAWPILIVLSLGSLISAACGAVGNILLMTGHQRISFFNSVSVVILNIVLGVILTPRYGAMGTAISTGLALGVVNVARLIEVGLLFKIHPYRWETVKPVGAGLISCLLTGGLLYLLGLSHISFQLSHYGLSIQLVLIPVFLASYFAFIALFKITPEDQIVVDKIRKKFSRGKRKRKAGNLNKRSQVMSTRR